MMFITKLHRRALNKKIRQHKQRHWLSALPTGAGDGNRTRVFGLGSGHSAIELHLRGEHVYYNTKSVRCQDTERIFFKIIRKSFDILCQINII